MKVALVVAIVLVVFYLLVRFIVWFTTDDRVNPFPGDI